MQVEAEPYFEMCVEAACSCPSVGDCACFCDVIAAYAQACSEKGVSVSWRTNGLCRESSVPPPPSSQLLFLVSESVISGLATLSLYI